MQRRRGNIGKSEAGIVCDVLRIENRSLQRVAEAGEVSASRHRRKPARSLIMRSFREVIEEFEARPNFQERFSGEYRIEEGEGVNEVRSDPFDS